MRVPRKLTDEQVVKIRVHYARGYRSSYQLAEDHGVTQAAILCVVQGSTYKSVAGPITWPHNQKPLAGFSDSSIAGRVRARQLPPVGKNHGQCWDVACTNQIAPSGLAQRSHMCADCFRINGGRKCGRTPAGRIKTVTCRMCCVRFEYYVKPNGYYPRCCSRKCSTLYSGAQRTKRPPTLTRDVLYELYWGQDMTEAEIASRLGDSVSPSGVHHWLVTDGIARRARNWRMYPTCAVEGCDQPKHRLYNGIRWYGRLCKEHLYDRRRRREQYYQSQLTEQRGGDLRDSIRPLLFGLPDSVKADAEQEIVIAVLSGEIADVTRETIKPYIARVFRENADAYKFVSLAAPIRQGEDAQTWGERLGIA